MNYNSLTTFIFFAFVTAALAEYNSGHGNNDLISKIQQSNNMSLVAQYGNKMYFLSTDNVPLMNWDQARSTCHDFGLVHARFGNGAEQYYVRNEIMFIVQTVWVAGSMKGYLENRISARGGFEWDDGSDIAPDLPFMLDTPLCSTFFSYDYALHPQSCSNTYKTLCQLQI